MKLNKNKTKRIHWNNVINKHNLLWSGTKIPTKTSGKEQLLVKFIFKKWRIKTTTMFVKDLAVEIAMMAEMTTTTTAITTKILAAIVMSTTVRTFRTQSLTTTAPARICMYQISAIRSYLETVIFLFNVSIDFQFQTDEDQLRNLFEAYGEIASISIVREPVTRVSR